MQRLVPGTIQVRVNSRFGGTTLEDQDHVVGTHGCLFTLSRRLINCCRVSVQHLSQCPHMDTWASLTRAVGGSPSTATCPQPSLSPAGAQVGTHLLIQSYTLGSPGGGADTSDLPSGLGRGPQVTGFSPHSPCVNPFLLIQEKVSTKCQNCPQKLKPQTLGGYIGTSL